MFEIEFEDKSGKKVIVNAADVRDASAQNKHLGTYPRGHAREGQACAPPDVASIGPLVRLELRDGSAVTVKGELAKVTARVRKALGGA